MAQAAREIPINEVDTRGEDTHGKVDPAVHPIDQARSQQHALTQGIADHFIGKASALRDQIDETIRQQRADTEEEHRRQEVYAAKSKERADVVKIMTDAFLELSAPTSGRVLPSITEMRRARG